MSLLAMMLVTLLSSVKSEGSQVHAEFQYHNYEEITDFLTKTAESYPDITHLYSIGSSVEGRQLWVLAIAGVLPEKHVFKRPEVKYVANVHGNEVVSREMMIHLVEHLVSTYRNNDNVTHLLDNTRIHIMVSMNPDGYEYADKLLQLPRRKCAGDRGRANSNNVDLNRNFPDSFQDIKSSEEIETQSVMKWLKSEHFVLSGNLHGGTLVANYPFDNTKTGSGVYSPTQDDDVFRTLASAYADAHPTMHKGRNCGEYFKNGITNGAEWYAIPGAMSDYNYVATGCMEVTIEMSCCKFPEPSTLEDYWRDNKNALIKYLQQVHMGVRGVVKTETGIGISNATMHIAKRGEVKIEITHLGEYWKLLLPGDYRFKVSAYGYHGHQEWIRVSKVVTDKDFILKRDYNIELPEIEKPLTLQLPVISNSNTGFLLVTDKIVITVCLISIIMTDIYVLS